MHLYTSGGGFFSACMPVMFVTMFVAESCEIVPACFRDLFYTYFASFPLRLRMMGMAWIVEPVLGSENGRTWHPI